ncbi:Lrp/AsnC family transcriptional regulator [Flavobacterium luminosum]|uniref:Lrp/AsnC family transcriptional regulator n=1 Tax=Flavobacterium luminosum TaxID=2949086 RepID=A0ABT0TRB2_9FLAO|nr:Lrp/AsnC family transcriptional regulator [Flavobacterium sp. HXWNR70]MCL9809935.1 Lrp/AsnC family transcriptional regulator [Flavobacterium sp. HXWNR70]
MDKIDAKILNILQEDCTLSVKDVAAMVGLSYTPTYERIKNLQESGVIKKSAVILDPSKVGIKLFAYCNVTLKQQSKENLKSFEDEVIKLPEILEVTSLSGVYDYVLKIATADIDAYNDFVVNKLANIPNIGQYHSNIVMSMVKNETSYHLPED